MANYSKTLCIHWKGDKCTALAVVFKLTEHDPAGGRWRFVIWSNEFFGGWNILHSCEDYENALAYFTDCVKGM